MNEVTLPTTWTKKTYTSFIKELANFTDKKFKDFTSRIVFTNYPILGIRTNILEALSKRISKTDYLTYLKISIPKSHEEILLRGMVISNIKDYDTFLTFFWDFLKYIDNWATCDQIIARFKIIRKNKDKFFPIIQELLNKDEEYYVRVGLIILMDYYLEENRLNEIYSYLDSIKHEGYYVHMAIAWLLSIAYIKFPAKTEEYFKNNKLKAETINKAIQKIRDSKRVSQKDKNYLLRYKID